MVDMPSLTYLMSRKYKFLTSVFACVDSIWANYVVSEPMDHQCGLIWLTSYFLRDLSRAIIFHCKCLPFLPISSLFCSDPKAQHNCLGQPKVMPLPIQSGLPRTLC